jgi:hypothetical protein
MGPDERRFQRAVRKAVRDHVAAAREAPPLTLWCSEGRNPRRVLSARVGAAHDAAGVRSYIVAQIRLHKPAWCCIGRGLHVPGDSMGVLEATTLFALVFVSTAKIEAVMTEIVAGDVGAWRDAPEVAGVSRTEALAGEGAHGAAESTWTFVQQALRTVARERDGDEPRGAVELDG